MALTEQQRKEWERGAPYSSAFTQAIFRQLREAQENHRLQSEHDNGQIARLAVEIGNAQTGTAGWLSPEVREQAANMIRILVSLAHMGHMQLSEGCDIYPCPEARAALDALEVK